jgi:hypothetical protein
MAGPERGQFEPEEKRELSLAEHFPSALVGEVNTETASGNTRVVQAFELIVDPADAAERRAVAVGFCMKAAALGYEPAMPPVMFPEAGFRDPRGTRPLTAMYFFLTPPVATN